MNLIAKQELDKAIGNLLPLIDDDDKATYVTCKLQNHIEFHVNPFRNAHPIIHEDLPDGCRVEDRTICQEFDQDKYITNDEYGHPAMSAVTGETEDLVIPKIENEEQDSLNKEEIIQGAYNAENYSFDIVRDFFGIKENKAFTSCMSIPGGIEKIGFFGKHLHATFAKEDCKLSMQIHWMDERFRSKTGAFEDANEFEFKGFVVGSSLFPAIDWDCVCLWGAQRLKDNEEKSLCFSTNLNRDKCFNRVIEALKDWDENWEGWQEQEAKQEPEYVIGKRYRTMTKEEIIQWAEDNKIEVYLFIDGDIRIDDGDRELFLRKDEMDFVGVLDVCAGYEKEEGYDYTLEKGDEIATVKKEWLIPVEGE